MGRHCGSVADRYTVVPRLSQRSRSLPIALYSYHGQAAAGYLFDCMGLRVGRSDAGSMCTKYSSSWYYGFHLSELNYPAASLQCDQGPTSTLRACLGIDQKTYGLITAIYTVGGLAGSLISSVVVKQSGVKRGITLTGWLNLAGAAIMTLATHWTLLCLGRWVIQLTHRLEI